MVLRAYLFHLRARNLSPRTIKATEEYLRLFFAACDPLTADKRTIENYLAELSERCKPATVATAWRHIRGLYKWLEAEGDIAINPMALIRKPEQRRSRVGPANATHSYKDSGMFARARRRPLA